MCINRGETCLRQSGSLLLSGRKLAGALVACSSTRFRPSEWPGKSGDRSILRDNRVRCRWNSHIARDKSLLGQPELCENSSWKDIDVGDGMESWTRSALSFGGGRLIGAIGADQRHFEPPETSFPTFTSQCVRPRLARTSPGKGTKNQRRQNGHRKEQMEIEPTINVTEYATSVPSNSARFYPTPPRITVEHGRGAKHLFSLLTTDRYCICQ